MSYLYSIRCPQETADSAEPWACDNFLTLRRATMQPCDNTTMRQRDHATTRNAKIRKKFATRCQHGILTQYLAVM